MSQTPQSAPVVAGVLVGGRSRRMGRVKALLPHPDAGTFVEHVVGCATAVAEKSFLLGVMHSLPPSLCAYKQLADSLADGGPLAGLDALLKAIGTGWGLLLSCDMPLLEPETLRHLLHSRTTDCDAIAYRVAADSDRLHACCALYHTRLRSTVEAELSGQRRLQSILKKARTVILEPTPEQQRSLINVNEPEDLNALGFSYP